MWPSFVPCCSRVIHRLLLYKGCCYNWLNWQHGRWIVFRLHHLLAGGGRKSRQVQLGRRRRRRTQLAEGHHVAAAALVRVRVLPTRFQVGAGTRRAHERAPARSRSPPPAEAGAVPIGGRCLLAALLGYDTATATATAGVRGARRCVSPLPDGGRRRDRPGLGFAAELLVDPGRSRSRKEVVGVKRRGGVGFGASTW